MVGLVGSLSVQAQTHRVPRTDSLGMDARLFFRVHSWESPAASVWLGTTDRSAYPVFLGTAPALFALGERGPAATTGMSMATALAGALVWKRISGRERPYARWSHVRPRPGYPGTRHLSPDASLPSGHMAMATALATALTLESRSTWVAGGSSAWAASVGVSRVWLGVHHPGDILAGAVLGVGAGIAAHLVVHAVQR